MLVVLRRLKHAEDHPIDQPVPKKALQCAHRNKPRQPTPCAQAKSGGHRQQNVVINDGKNYAHGQMREDTPAKLVSL